MAENSSIEWTDHTFNPWEGCQKVGPGCDNCYAEARNARFGGGVAVNWGPGAPRRRTSEANWRKPKAWNAAHDKFFAEHGRRQRVFCASLADVFDNAVPVQWRADLLQLIDLTPNLDWLLLTKRIGNVAPMLADIRRAAGGATALSLWPRPNIWLGATVVNQEEADRHIPKLLAVPARVRFLSIEPMLGPIRLDALHGRQHNAPFNAINARPNGYVRCVDHAPGYCLGDCPGRLPALDWVICGGESGPHARPMSPDWARSLRDQCRAAGVAFLFKQWGEWMPMLGQAEGVTVRPEKATTPDGWVMGWAGKKASGRLLDGVEHNGFPHEA